MAKKKKQHYVNNADLFDAMVEYKNSVAEAEKLGNKKPVSYTHLTLPTIYSV